MYLYLRSSHFTIIGEIIKRRRTALDMTQVELAEKAKITQAKISQIENGASDNVTIDDPEKIGQGFELRLG